MRPREKCCEPRDSGPHPSLQPPVLAFNQRLSVVPAYGRTLNSVRRFLARPSGVSLVATGLVSPKPSDCS